MSRLLTALAVTVMAGGAFTGVAAAQQIGVNAVVKNEVSIQGAADADPRAASVGDDVALRDVIRSGVDSALQVLLLDETVFTVGPEAQLTVDRFVYDPDRDAGEMAASVARGAFRFMSGRTAKRSGGAEVSTPVASMGVRGTVVEGAIGADEIRRVLAGTSYVNGVTLTDGSTLVVLRGPAESQSGLNKDGVVDVQNNVGSVTLSKANTFVLVPGPDQPMIGPFLMPTLSSVVLRDLLGTTPAGISPGDLPRIILPTGEQLDTEQLIDPVGLVENEQILDRPTGNCGVIDGIPTTDGGIILGGQSGVEINDFGTTVICTE